MINNIMVDLETFGVGNDALVLSVGAVKFDNEGEPLEKFHMFIDPESQPERNIDFSTVIWWMSQDDEARGKITQDKELQSLKDTLNNFLDFCNSYGEVKSEDVYIWGNGNMFDNVILRDLFKSEGIKYPAHYRNDLDMRTLKYLYEATTGQDESDYCNEYASGVQHDALDDSIYQAKIVAHIIKDLRR